MLQHFENSFSRMDASHFEPSSYIDAAVGVPTLALALPLALALALPLAQTLTQAQTLTLTQSQVLRAQPPLAFWTSPPLGCFFLLCPALPCAQPQQPTPRLVAVLRRAVLLYSAGA